jgi:hypothetical protein
LIQAGALLLSGSAFVLGDTVFVLTGPSGSGKTNALLHAMETLPANFLSEDLLLCYRQGLLSAPSRISIRRFPSLGALDYVLFSASHRHVDPKQAYPGRIATSHTGAAIFLFLEQSADNVGFYRLPSKKGLEKLQILINRVCPFFQERLIQGYAYAHGVDLAHSLLTQQREILRVGFGQSRFYISSFTNARDIPVNNLSSL